MAIDNPEIIDGIGIDNSRKAICLLLTDHLMWQGDDNPVNEYDHLILLQDKINAYLSYLEAKQYKSQYPESVFHMAVIEIHFKYDISGHCKKFLQAVQDQVGQYGIKIETHIG